MGLVCEEIKSAIIKDEMISVKNFGTISTYLYHGHQGYNVHTKKVEYVKPIRVVKFHPHAAFSKLIKERRKRFLKKQK